ncbi:kinase-like protein [Hypoxylon sp. NC1633]|nr:kinase-like protein [Hypoxylon sp. NC1633]
MNRARELCQNDTNLLKEYFAKDPRFSYRQMVGFGGYGSAHRVQYTDDRTQQTTQFLVKRSFPTAHAERALRKERAHLMSLRGAMHIVRTLDIPNNPLKDDDFPGEWIVLEWLPGGTVGDFMWNALDQKVDHLPNRLLWRFFLCLVRGCCGLAWPLGRTDDTQVTETPIPGVLPGELQHNDLHRGNFLLGDFAPFGVPDEQHGITPILKIIDFGLAGIFADDPDAPTGVQSNVWDIGKIMVSLIKLDPRIRVDTPGTAPGAPFMFNGDLLQTQATAMFEGCEWLDEYLGTLVALCLASDHDMRPTLQSLCIWLPYAIHHRDGPFYNRPEEQDHAIGDLCRRIIHNAPSGDVIVISS